MRKVVLFTMRWLTSFDSLCAVPIYGAVWAQLCYDLCRCVRPLGSEEGVVVVCRGIGRSTWMDAITVWHGGLISPRIAQNVNDGGRCEISSYAPFPQTLPRFSTCLPQQRPVSNSARAQQCIYWPAATKDSFPDQTFFPNNQPRIYFWTPIVPATWRGRV